MSLNYRETTIDHAWYGAIPVVYILHDKRFGISSPLSKETVRGMKIPLVVARTGNQGSEGVSHFLNHQKRSIKDRPTRKYNSGAMPIPPFLL